MKIKDFALCVEKIDEETDFEPAKIYPPEIKQTGQRKSDKLQFVEISQQISRTAAN